MEESYIRVLLNYFLYNKWVLLVAHRLQVNPYDCTFYCGNCIFWVLKTRLTKQLHCVESSLESDRSQIFIEKHSHTNLCVNTGTTWARLSHGCSHMIIAQLGNSTQEPWDSSHPCDSAWYPCKCHSGVELHHGEEAPMSLVICMTLVKHVVFQSIYANGHQNQLMRASLLHLLFSFIHWACNPVCCNLGVRAIECRTYCYELGTDAIPPGGRNHVWSSTFVK